MTLFSFKTLNSSTNKLNLNPTRLIFCQGKWHCEKSKVRTRKSDWVKKKKKSRKRKQSEWESMAFLVSCSSVACFSTLSNSSSMSSSSSNLANPGETVSFSPSSSHSKRCSFLFFVVFFNYPLTLLHWLFWKRLQKEI